MLLPGNFLHEIHQGLQSLWQKMVAAPMSSLWNRLLSVEVQHSQRHCFFGFVFIMFFTCLIQPPLLKFVNFFKSSCLGCH